jgi:hypothetical protein
MTSNEKPQQSKNTSLRTSGRANTWLETCKSASLCAQGQTKASRDRGATHPPGHDTGRKGNRAHQARQGQVEEPRRGSANGEPLFAFPCQPPLLKAIAISLGGRPACCLAIRLWQDFDKKKRTSYLAGQNSVDGANNHHSWVGKQGVPFPTASDLRE